MHAYLEKGSEMEKNHTLMVTKYCQHSRARDKQQPTNHKRSFPKEIVKPKIYQLGRVSHYRVRQTIVVVKQTNYCMQGKRQTSS